MTGDANIYEAAAIMKDKELSYIENSHATIILSEYEREVLAKDKRIEPKLWTIPLIREMKEREADFESSQDILFIGGYRHPPQC